MFLRPQDIIIIKNMIFKDNNKIDFHLHGRPALIIANSIDSLYYLTISTHLPSKDSCFNYQYYHLNKEKTGARENSQVNLRNIYKVPTVGYQSLGYIPDDIFYRILLKFKYYQENLHTDSLYPEIKIETESMMRKLKRR